MIGLYNGLSPVLHGAQAIGFKVDPIVVVVIDILGNFLGQMATVSEAHVMKHFRLGNGEEALHGRVIQAITFARHVGVR